MPRHFFFNLLVARYLVRGVVLLVTGYGADWLISVRGWRTVNVRLLLTVRTQKRLPPLYGAKRWRKFIFTSTCSPDTGCS